LAGAPDLERVRNPTAEPESGGACSGPDGAAATDFLPRALAGAGRLAVGGAAAGDAAAAAVNSGADGSWASGRAGLDGGALSMLLRELLRLPAVTQPRSASESTAEPSEPCVLSMLMGWLGEPCVLAM